MGLFSKRSPSGGPSRSEPSSTPSTRVNELTGVEQDWITSLLAIVADAGTDIDDAAQIRSLYDDSVARWYRVNPPERVDPDPMINAIGTALGEHVERRTRLRWALTIDDGRTELGLVDDSRLALAPTELVAERWHGRSDGGFVIETVDRLTERFPPRSGRRRP